MKYKIVRCLTRQPIDEEPRWMYARKEWSDVVTKYEKNSDIGKHRVPWFLSLHAHLRIEETLEDLASLMLPQFEFKIVRLFYDIIHGLICGYEMREILKFWRRITKNNLHGFNF